MWPEFVMTWQRHPGRSTRHARVAVLLVMCASMLLVRTSRADKPQWLADAIAGWHRLEQRRAPVRWSVTFADDCGDQPSYQFFISKRRGSQFVHFMWESDKFSAIPEDPFQVATEAFVRNRDYVFRVRRMTASHPWVLVSVVRCDQMEDPENEHYDWTHRILTSLDYEMLWSPVRLQNVLLSELFEGEYVRDVQAAEVEEEGIQLQEVRFVLPATPKQHFPRSQQGPLPRTEARIVLDPNHDWRLVKADVVQLVGDSNAPARLSYEYEYVYDSASDEIRKIVTRSPKQNCSLQEIYTDVRFDEEYNDSEFRLPAFGIPEPAELKPKANWWRWYVLAGMIGTVLIIAGLKLRRR